MSDCTPKGTPLFDRQPSCNDTEPADCGEAFIEKCGFELCDGEQGLFDCFAQEHVSIAGTTVEFFHLSIDESSRDPLYDEAIERVFQGSYQVKAFMKYPDAATKVGEFGLKKTWDAEAWIPRAELERVSAPAPSEGDILRVWDSGFFDRYSVLDQNIPNSGFFFSVTKSVEDGHIFDRAGFVGIKCFIRRTTEYAAERRLLND